MVTRVRRVNLGSKKKFRNSSLAGVSCSVDL
jgi:hypothetical protein